MQPGGWVLAFPQRCRRPGGRAGGDRQAPLGTWPWRWQALTRRHKGLLPGAHPLKPLPPPAAQGTEGPSLQPRAQAPLCFCSGEARSCHHCVTMLRTLGLALLPLLSTVGSGQASGFTGEGPRPRAGGAGGGSSRGWVSMSRGSSPAESRAEGSICASHHTFLQPPKRWRVGTRGPVVQMQILSQRSGWDLELCIPAGDTGKQGHRPS